ncbi:hypothetical protein SM0020_12170 [Sinorhizobium meliloti CCNWSX0020]|uniref:Uncharacterized protein n=1 Tax=Sinorhizobium meliloti CCNWSX0020 TaxID=1107881 RepID=H0FZ00_RHIML|nr:hypothetical protein [Sinorhizobium meliloti]EHK77680.1 hypothetical protein SM0020_12170 [Sinorhizobium meliloti CCNWSX0020]
MLTKPSLADLLIELIDARIAEKSAQKSRPSATIAKEIVDLLVDRIESPEFYRNLDEAAE